MAKPIMGMIPPGGWHYFEGDVKLEAPFLLELYKLVENYRVENKLPQGDVQGDVDAQICGRSPHACHNIDSLTINVVSVAPATPSALLREDIQVWANNLLQSSTPYTFVGDDEAERRAKICNVCPQNANWQSGCSSCVATVQRVTAAVRQAKDTFTTPLVGGCNKLRHDNRTAVFLEKEYLSKASDLPAHCWINY
jgi:hypothetical protein